jgi:hypothetical protein
MVDFCRPSSLPGNNTLGTGNNNNNNDNNNNNNNNSKEGNSKFFPSVFLPYSHLIDPSRPVAVVAAKTAAAAATTAMEQTRLEEEKLRVQAKDKKDQSKLIIWDVCFF